jgi:hypothetical protein
MTLDLTGAGAGDGMGGKGDATTDAVHIPEGWADLAWLDLLALAKQFDAEVLTKDDAIAAVELEVERRKAK